MKSFKTIQAATAATMDTLKAMNWDGVVIPGLMMVYPFLITTIALLVMPVATPENRVLAIVPALVWVPGLWVMITELRDSYREAKALRDRK